MPDMRDIAPSYRLSRDALRDWLSEATARLSARGEACAKMAFAIGEAGNDARRLDGWTQDATPLHLAAMRDHLAAAAFNPPLVVRVDYLDGAGGELHRFRRTFRQESAPMPSPSTPDVRFEVPTAEQVFAEAQRRQVDAPAAPVSVMPPAGGAASVDDADPVARLFACVLRGGGGAAELAHLSRLVAGSSQPPATLDPMLLAGFAASNKAKDEAIAKMADIMCDQSIRNGADWRALAVSQVEGRVKAAETVATAEVAAALAAAGDGEAQWHGLLEKGMTELFDLAKMKGGGKLNATALAGLIGAKPEVISDTWRKMDAATKAKVVSELMKVQAEDAAAAAAGGA